MREFTIILLLPEYLNYSTREDYIKRDVVEAEGVRVAAELAKVRALGSSVRNLNDIKVLYAFRGNVTDINPASW